MEGTCDGSNMPPLEASRRLPTIFAGASMGFVFWAKAIGFHFVKLFGMCKRSNMYMEKKTLLQGMFV
jgi:hypothetical protein